MIMSRRLWRSIMFSNRVQTINTIERIIFTIIWVYLRPHEMSITHNHLEKVGNAGLTLRLRRGGCNCYKQQHTESHHSWKIHGWSGSPGSQATIKKWAITYTTSSPKKVVSRTRVLSVKSIHPGHERSQKISFRHLYPRNTCPEKQCE